MSYKNTDFSNSPESTLTASDALDLLREGDFKGAQESFTLLLQQNHANSIAESGIKCCKYWIPRIQKIETTPGGFQKGTLLIDEWKKFESFQKSVKSISAKVVSSIMFFIFNHALETLIQDMNRTTMVDSQTLSLIAFSYKKIGDFKNAVQYFSEALQSESHNSYIMAQLADCFALIDDERKAKILFREAFHIDPSSIELELLDSNIINSIIIKMREHGVKQKDLKYWLPVYGRVFNVFSIMRELIPVELARLKQEIFQLEKDLQSGANRHESWLQAQLLNCYLLLYDYGQHSNNTEMVISITGKIHVVSDEIYQILINN
jgi:tetratricopeptide (TPR) repeat protein